MNVPHCTDEDYIQFLIAHPNRVSCTEAQACSGIAHDAYTRLLARASQQPETLWQEAQPFVRKDRGILVIDDSLQEKPHTEHTELVHWQWCGKKRCVRPGVGLQTLLWTDGVRLIPCDYRLFNAPVDGLTKNDHFQSLLATAKGREFKPEYVAFDSWFSGLKNLKQIAEYGWLFLTRLRSNRQVNPTGEKKGNVPVTTLTDLPEEGQVVHLKGFGMIRLFRVNHAGEWQYWATNDLQMTEAKRQVLEQKAWGIEVYHRGLKQACQIEGFYCRTEAKVRGHLLLAVRAFLRLEYYRLKQFVSWYEARLQVVRDSVTRYLQHPTILLPSTA
jgi:putative transposase